MYLIHNGVVTIVLTQMGRDFLERFPPSSSFFGRVEHPKRGKPGEIHITFRTLDEVATTRCLPCVSDDPCNEPGKGLRRVWEVEDVKHA